MHMQEEDADDRARLLQRLRRWTIVRQPPEEITIPFPPPPMRRPIRERFASHRTDDDQNRMMSVVRERCLSLADLIEKQVPEPEASQAIDLIEQAMFISNSGIARG
jgi:hypothetical protein